MFLRFGADKRVSLLVFTSLFGPDNATHLSSRNIWKEIWKNSDFIFVIMTNKYINKYICHCYNMQLYIYRRDCHVFYVWVIDGQIYFYLFVSNLYNNASYIYIYILFFHTATSMIWSECTCSPLYIYIYILSF